MTSLLWADDDCDEFLDPLSRRLKRGGFLLRKATNYTDALDILRAYEVHSMLVDIILPHAVGTGALGYDLGLVLADRAADAGVKAISFLTVMPMDEVRDTYQRLRSAYPTVRFEFFDKNTLLEPSTIELVLDSLK